MDKSYEFVEDEYEEGITLKKIAHFFKKGWLRMIVYVVVCLLVALIVALPIRMFYKSEPIAQTTIEYIYDGIEDGLAPDGSLLSTDNLVTNKILAAAVDNADLGGKITDISALRQHVRVEGVETAKYAALVEAAASGDAEAAATLRTYVMHPTSFNIIISDPASLGLTDSEAKKLLNSVVSSYYSDFLTRFSVQNMFPADMFGLSSDQSIEFRNILDIYENVLESIRTSLSDFATENPDFVSRVNNTSFATLVSEFIVLESRLDLLNGYIATNNIWLDKVAARDSLVDRKTSISNRIATQQSYITALNAQIELINREFDLVADGDKQQVVIGKYPEVYNECHRKLQEANDIMRDYQSQLASVEVQLEKLGDDDTATPAVLVSEAKSRIAALEQSIVQKVNVANSTIDDYYTTQFISSSVRQIRQPVVVRVGLHFSMAAVFAVAGVIGLLAAFMVTGIKISLANSARVKSKKQSETAATTTTETPDENTDEKKVKKTAKNNKSDI
ncbi:MAG: hypothetical protein NC184_07945 [Roseburia sp.]|nr:hypothetical protein [Roseburia sp.]